MIKYLKRLLDAGDYLVGINNRNIGYVYPNNPRKYFPYANDKALTKKVLEENGVPTADTYTIISNLWEINEKLKAVENVSTFVVKPAQGSGGGGILLLKKVEDGVWKTPSGEVYNREKLEHHVATVIYGIYSSRDSDKAIIEYCLTPHSFFTNIYDKGVPDFRVLLYHDDPIMAMLRVPTKQSGGKANLHQGAIGIGIDMKSGKLLEGFHQNKYIKEHPDSKTVFEGMDIPDWEKAIDISVKTSKLFPLNYLGVDIIVDEVKGPLVIEINVRPGLQIQNINKTGLIEVLKNRKNN